MPMIVCSSCSQHVHVHDPACPHCGTALRTVAAPSTVSLVLLGLALAACPADDYRDSLGDDDSSTAAPTSTGTGTETTDATTTGGMSMTGMATTSTSTDTSTVGSEAAYGVPATESDSLTDTATDGSSSGGDSTGDSTGTGGDSTTAGSVSGGEPLYGALDSG